MKLRKLKNGRIKDMDSGLIVSDKLAKSIMGNKPIKPLKTKKSKRGKKNAKKEHAVNTITIKQYRDGDWSCNFGNKGVTDKDLLAIGNHFVRMVDVHDDEKIRKDHD